MNLGIILHLLGVVYIFLGSSMLLPFLVSLYYGDGDSLSILSSAIITLTIGILLFLLFYKKEREISHKEGFLIVALAWVSIGFFGALPYLFSGTLTSLVDAYFESIAGFTTTGATVFSDVEGLPHGILLWRSLSQWLGGMGIILLSVAILPLLGVGGMQLYKAEAPGIKSEKLKPRIAETAKSLWYVYLVLTFAESFLLYLGGMNPFDAINHSLTTLATGGFSTNNLSVSAYNSPFVEGVITFFMFVAGINFTLHYLLLGGGIRTYWESREFRFYLLTILLFIFIISIDLFFSLYRDIFTSLRYASFQVVSIMTTTGFTTADYETWPFLSQFLLLILMFIGGSAGSTAGGIKVVRILLLLKQGYRELYRLIHPHAVVPVKLGNKTVDVSVMEGIWGFFFIYLSVFIAASIIMASLSLDIISAIASVAATLGNVGPGLGMVGPMDNFGAIPSLGKVTLIFTMLLGRLEIFTILILFTPEFWKR